MKISQDGINLIKYFEGCPMKDGMVISYRCPANKPTIGFGSLKLKDGSPVQDGMTITKQEAEELLTHELKEFEGDSVTLEIYDPEETIRGVVESVAYPVINNASIGSGTQYCTVRVKGVRAVNVTTADSNILGIGTIGVVRLG